MKRARIIRYFDTAAHMGREAAHCVAAVLADAVRQRGWAALLLAGGATPRLLYRQLAGSRMARRIPWASVHVFWGDERCVPQDSPGSNYAMASDALLSRVSLPRENIHRINVERGWKRAAAAYEKNLREFFIRNGRNPDTDAGLFDMALLGLGADGHTASLFPGSPALDEIRRWAVPAEAPPGVPYRKRVTLTVAALNRSRYVLFLIGGKAKRSIVRRILYGKKPPAASFPAGRIRPAAWTAWFIHDPAADQEGKAPAATARRGSVP